ncbi:MAG: hypothetical protein KDD44_09560 [Bdellovibrionales bacterium]|nr:hypothetical protein [Bdellovibrionales bacterium]
MEATNKPINTFLKRVIEIGNTPIWEPKKRERRRSAREETDTQYRQFDLQGLLKPGSRTPYSIAGEDIVIDENTFIVGTLQIGAIGKVKGVVKPGIGRYATKIVVTADSSS